MASIEVGSLENLLLMFLTYSGRLFRYLKNSNLKFLKSCILNNQVLLILSDTVNNEFGTLLNHDRVVTFEGHVGGMLVVKVGQA